MSALQISILLLVFSIAIFVFFLTTGVVGGATQDRRKVSERIETVKGKDESLFAGINDKKERKRMSLENKAKTQSQHTKKLMDAIFNELVLADIMMKPEEFCIVWLLLIFGPSSLSALFSAQLISSITLAAFGVAIPFIYISSKKKKRVKIFEQQLGDALMIICNSLRSGLSFQQALDTIAVDMPAPIGLEFGRVTNEIRYGATMEDALNNMVKRVKSADLLLAVSAVNIQRQTGGNLSEILDSISATIKERLRIKGEISSLTAQGRISGLMIGGVPVAIFGILLVATPGYMTQMFETTLGRIMLIAAVVMEIIGFLAIRKVVTIEY